jgi:hypothetical protein
MQPSETLEGKLADIMFGLERFAKDDKVEGRGAYSFTSINAIADVLRPAMAARGIVMTPRETEVIECGEVARQKVDNNGVAYMQYQWRTVLRVSWCVSDGLGVISIETIGEALDTSDKSANKAMTAARKQALINLFLISTGDADPDHDRPGEDDQPTQSGTAPTGKQVGFLRGRLKTYRENFDTDEDARRAFLVILGNDDRTAGYLEEIDATLIGEADFTSLPRPVVSAMIDLAEA